MRKHLRLVLAPASVLLLGFAWHAGITFTPPSHDFGPVLINTAKATGGNSMQEFKVELPPNSPLGTTLKLAITGAGQKDYFVTPSTIDPTGPYAYSLQGVFMVGAASAVPLKSCEADTARSSFSCRVMVVFQPHADGLSSAELVATDSRGGQGTASLIGNGIAEAPCELAVVSCNFGYLYTGTFNWSFTIKSADSKTEMVVSIGVNDGKAACDGSETITDHGNSSTGKIKGPGLFAVEWFEDSAYTWAYKITAACPTPNFPAGPNGEAASPSQPANLSGNVQETPPMPDRATKKDWSLQQTIAWLKVLEGNYTIPAPETDPANGVSGTLTHAWKLTRR